MILASSCRDCARLEESPQAISTRSSPTQPPRIHQLSIIKFQKIILNSNRKPWSPILKGLSLSPGLYKSYINSCKKKLPYKLMWPDATPAPKKEKERRRTRKIRTEFLPRKNRRRRKGATPNTRPVRPPCARRPPRPRIRSVDWSLPPPTLARCVC